MTIYTQQANSLMERLPIAEQQFILEFIKKISKNNNLSDTADEKRNPQEAIRRFIENINAITDEPLDEEFDEILARGINLRTPEELDLL